MVKKTLILPFIIIFLTIPIAFSTETPTIQFTDQYFETEKDYYFPYESIHVAGEGYLPDTSYSAYLVKDVTLEDGMAIPESVPDTATTVTSDSEGAIPLTEIWSQYNTNTSPYLSTGNYLIIIDIDNDGSYTEDVDVFDEMTIRYPVINTKQEKTVPTFHAPEIPGGTLLTLVTFALAILIYQKRSLIKLS
jgi:hypothetical protein